MKKIIVFSLVFYSCLSAMAQIQVVPGAVKKVETIKPNPPANLLTPDKPKIDGLGEFTYFENQSAYNKETKKLIIHGCKMTREGAPDGDDPRLPCYAYRVNVKILKTGSTQFRIDAEVVADKSQYEASNPAAARIESGITDLNSYQFRAIDAHWDSKNDVVVDEVMLNKVSGLQRLTLNLKQLPDGTPIPDWLFTSTGRARVLIIYLSADYDFELKSIKITPLN